MEVIPSNYLLVNLTAIATAFASIHPSKVSSLVLIAPAGLPVPIPWYAKHRIPLLSDVIGHLFFGKIIQTRAAQGFEGIGW